MKRVTQEDLMGFLGQLAAVRATRISSLLHDSEHGKALAMQIAANLFEVFTQGGAKIYATQVYRNHVWRTVTWSGTFLGARNVALAYVASHPDYKWGDDSDWRIRRLEA